MGDDRRFPDRVAATERFLEIEADLDLFERRVDGVHYWERVRFQAHRQVLRGVGLVGQAHGESAASGLRSVAQLLRNLVRRNPLLAPPADLLVYGHERRRRLDDGRWWDLYCDPVLPALDESVAYVEQPYGGSHRTPARTEGVRYLDLIEHGSNVPATLLPDDYLLSAADRSHLADVDRAFAGAFGVDLDLPSTVGRLLLRRRVQRPLFGRLVDRVDPDLAVVVVAYLRRTFVEACRARGVPVVELQHGVVSPTHLGYAYPGDRRCRTAPDYFLSFGEFWSSLVDFPFPDDRVYPVGYPYLEREAAARDPGGETDRVVFVSQGTVGTPLSRAAVAFAERSSREVVYKLHPGEYSRWREAYPWLVDAPLTVVDGDGPDLYDLFADAGAQVGVYSTALYEGLYFGLDTYVLDLPGVSYLDRLVAEGVVRKVADADALAAAVESPTPAVDTDRFFRPGAVENARAALAAIRAREAGGGRNTYVPGS